VNDPADMKRLVAMGVDGVVTDRADVALASLR
jgi:glycerophosphoryl diester phosphodiesterase